MRIGRKYLPPLALLLASTLAVVYAETTLFTQTFPTIPAASGTTANCTALAAFVAGVGTPLTSVAPGSSGSALVDCSGSDLGTVSAFSIRVPAGDILVTPQFTLPTGYSSVGILPVNGPPTADAFCVPGQSPVILTSGRSVLLVTGSYVYCAEFAEVPNTGLPSFSITWATHTTPFTQTFPDISADAGVRSNCTTLTPYDPTDGFRQIRAVATGSSGFIYFDCSGTSSAGTTSAFSVISGGPVTFTPHFDLPAPYVSVALNPINPLACDGASFRDVIVSGSAFGFSGSDNFGYCVRFQTAPDTGLPAFEITWTT